MLSGQYASATDFPRQKPRRVPRLISKAYIYTYSCVIPSNFQFNYNSINIPDKEKERKRKKLKERERIDC